MTSWLRGQKKSELVDIAESIGLPGVASLKKTELESALDEFLTENAAQLSSDRRLTPYFNIRAKSSGSPVKKEASEPKPRRRTTKTSTQEEIVAVNDAEPSAASTALVRTPARALSLASRIPLPSSPAEVASAVDRSALAVRERVVTIYADSGVSEATLVTRETLSTAYAIIALVSAFELYYLRPEIIPNRFAFAIPAVSFLGTSAYSVSLPDVFLLATPSFWNPTLLWAAISLVIPAVFGYFINLSAANGSHHSGRGRSRPFGAAEYAVDPLTFSVVKALLVFIVLGQGVVPGSFFTKYTIDRLDSALYGGWKGSLVGTAITGLGSFYEAVLRK